MDFGRTKLTAEWFRERCFSDESITPRKPEAKEQLPSLLRTARSLEQSWQRRESVFLQQAKLLEQYEDDYPFDGQLTRYYPTYQSLTDQELRGYFSWRTKLRRGELIKAPLSFAFLYIYELLNQVGADDALDGYRKLTAFRDSYGPLDSGILPYMKYWLRDYVVYYNLEPELLDDPSILTQERGAAVLENIQQENDEAIISALNDLGLKWLNRSKFFATHKKELTTVTARVLRAVAAHCDSRCKKGFVEQYVGSVQTDLEWLFSSAVFCDPLKRTDYEYRLSSRCVYRCRKGQWTSEKFSVSHKQCAKLEDLLKAIDREMRLVFDPKHPLKGELNTKWIQKIIRDEIQRLLQEQKAAEAKKITIDRSQLAKIRQDAAITREKLIVEEELEETEETPEAPEPEDESQDTPLSPTEYRLMQCLLYGTDRSWVRTEGLILSVLLDSINEKLYDVFQDSVLLEDEIIEDYIDELKEMIRP